jgi:hypothetical protein
VLCISGFELYGRMKRKPRKPPATPTNRFAVVELLNSDEKKHQKFVEGTSPSLSSPQLVLTGYE